MNFYDVLQVVPTATTQEIKKAYHQLIIKYHPDKNKDPDAIQKFIDIRNAYDVLGDESKKLEYDILTQEQKIELYDLIKKYMTNLSPKYANLYVNILGGLELSETEIKQDINAFEFGKLYNKIITKISQSEIAGVLWPKQETKIILEKQDLDIIGVIHCTLQDRYLGKLKKIKVYRESTKNKSTYYVDITHDNVLISNGGESYDNKTGDIILDVLCEINNKYTVIDTYDLILVAEISLYEYLFGGCFIFEHLDGEELRYDFNGFTDSIPMIVLDEKGLKKENETRGKLFIHFKICDLENYRELIHKLSNK